MEKVEELAHKIRTRDPNCNAYLVQIWGQTPFELWQRATEQGVLTPEEWWAILVAAKQLGLIEKTDAGWVRAASTKGGRRSHG
ncbi:MAG: hypothetical protein HC910_22835 [Spirulinaceae cyanobacterium SM2_1_0]|nr:hypothetical protein [Spirulinaceae cyanobacterium SM2_1_0]